MTLSRTQRALPYLLIFITGVCFGWAVKWLAGVAAGRVTTISLSPDDKTQAALIEQFTGIDRNFTVRIGPARGDPHSLDIVFHSPDEGRPIGSERFIWSTDGQYVLLVGRHFYVKGSVRMRTGEDLYLLYHLPSGRLRCTAKQYRGERFEFTDLSDITFVEPVVAKPEEVEPPSR